MRYPDALSPKLNGKDSLISGWFLLRKGLIELIFIFPVGASMWYKLQRMDCKGLPFAARISSVLERLFSKWFLSCSLISIEHKINAIENAINKILNPVRKGLNFKFFIARKNAFMRSIFDCEIMISNEYHVWQWSVQHWLVQIVLWALLRQLVHFRHASENSAAWNWIY